MYTQTTRPEVDEVNPLLASLSHWWPMNESPEESSPESDWLGWDAWVKTDEGDSADT